MVHTTAAGMSSLVVGDTMENLTIVMYHYVRPIKNSAWPGIKGLEFDDFIGQLDHIQRQYSLIGAADIIAAHAGEALPLNAALLTFDDGYLDHYQYAFPELKRRSILGAFFPPARAVLEGQLLDVNKIHFILAATGNHTAIADFIDAKVSAAIDAFDLQPVAAYRNAHAHPNRFDTAEIIYIKRMLQHALPKVLRTKIADALFAKFVTTDEVAFAAELYCSPNQLAEMAEDGMSIGGHGYAHHWLDSLTREQQRQDIALSHGMLKDIGALKDHFLFCYPYGAFNADTLELLQDLDCQAAFTTKVSKAYVGPGADMLQLPRMDTNDLPKKVPF